MANNKKEPFKTIERVCMSCNRRVIIRDSDKSGYNSKKCSLCRKAIKEQNKLKYGKNQKIKQAQNKEKDNKEFAEKLLCWNTVPFEYVVPDNEHVLYIIGNGFDLMHQVKSSFYSFRDSMGKNNDLRYSMENYTKCKDVWGDFEEALGKFDIAKMADRDNMGNMLDITRAYDEDNGMSAYCLAIDGAASPIADVNNNLQRLLRRWVESLTIGTDERPLQKMIQKGKVLNFNYTEFVETMYGVGRENICYIHGCRKSKSGHSKEELIIGHIPMAYEESFEFSDTKYKKKDTFIDVVQDQVLDMISAIDEGLTKKCDTIIKENSGFYDSLSGTEIIITIGHSFSAVDNDYFVEIIKRHPEMRKAKWYFGCFGLSDLLNLEKLIALLGLNKAEVFIFRTDTIRTKGKNTSTNTPQESKAPKLKVSVSHNKKWEAHIDDCLFLIKDVYNDKTSYEAIFPIHTYNSFFAVDDEYLFVIIKGGFPGIIIFHQEKEGWKFIAELEVPEGQNILNSRLKKVWLTDSDISFVYNNRIRKYSIKDGVLILNKGIYNEPRVSYEGEDVTLELTKYKKQEI